MTDTNTALVPQERCTAPQLYRAVTDYCFGHAAGAEQRIVEEHLSLCLVCRREVLQLRQAVDVLRFDQAIEPSFSLAEAAGAFGVSGKLYRLFGGHAVFVILSCVAYATLYNLW